jgi:hypothetical protein
MSAFTPHIDQPVRLPQPLPESEGFVTDARKIKLLRAAIKRALMFLPSPMVATLTAVLDLTK